MKWPGLYRGVVVSTEDPEGLSRIRAVVPDVLGTTPSAWAWPCAPSPDTAISVPDVGDGVWISFEAGEADHPVWMGVWFRPDDVPTSLLTLDARYVNTWGDTMTGTLRFVNWTTTERNAHRLLSLSGQVRPKNGDTIFNTTTDRLEVYYESDDTWRSFLPADGGTVSGNLAVTGNLTITGTTTGLNVTDTAKIPYLRSRLSDTALGSELVSNGSFTSNTTGWSVETSTTGVLTWRSTSLADGSPGSNGLTGFAEVSPGANTAAHTVTIVSTTATLPTNHPETVYEFKASVGYANAGDVGVFKQSGVRAGIRWYDGSNSLITEEMITGLPLTKPLTVWMENWSVRATPPLGARKAAVIFKVNFPDGGGGGLGYSSFVFLDEVSLKSTSAIIANNVVVRNDDEYSVMQVGPRSSRPYRTLPWMHIGGYVDVHQAYGAPNSGESFWVGCFRSGTLGLDSDSVYFSVRAELNGLAAFGVGSATAGMQGKLRIWEVTSGVSSGIMNILPSSLVLPADERGHHYRFYWKHGHPEPINNAPNKQDRIFLLEATLWTAEPDGGEATMRVWWPDTGLVQIDSQDPKLTVQPSTSGFVHPSVLIDLL